MPLSITALNGYVEENAFELLSKAVLNTSLANFIQIRAGLQGNNVAIPLMEDTFATAAYAVSGGSANMGENYASCGWAANGTTLLSQVNMDLYHAKVQRAYCVQTLRDTFMSRQLGAGAAAGAEALPFEQLAAEYFTKGVTKFNEYYLINGAATVVYPEGTDNTFAGIKGQLVAASTAVKFNSAASSQAGISLALKWVAGTAGAGQVNALDAALAMFDAADGRLMLADDLILVLGMEDYKTLVAAMVKADLYHYTGNVNEVIIPGTNIKAVASGGIAKTTGTYADRNFKFLTAGSNIIMGTDLTSDFDEFKVWYSQDNDEVRSSMKWTVGVSIIEPELCVSVNDTPAA